MDAETARIGQEIDDSAIREIAAKNPPHELVVYSDTHVGIPCKGAEYAVIGRAGDPVTKCTIRFMKANDLTFAFIDIDSDQGRDLIDLAGFSEIDIPYIYSAKGAEVVHTRTCPKTMRELL
jgi:hypothetical protein